MAKRSLKGFFEDRRLVVTIEEGILLVAGIIFGWFAGKGATQVLWVLLAVFISMVIVETIYFYVHGKRPKPPMKKK
ncbi:hypothetical protein GF374_02275 [Candidatus Woesearchaeota archaeon]|nr:hypothetical protein [Candidatus Woesearchaeota archaeon]